MKVTNELKVTNAFINRFCYLEPLACVSIYLFIYFKLTPCLDSKIYSPVAEAIISKCWLQMKPKPLF